MSQPSSTSGCECNWIMFKHIHSMRCNRSSVEKMNRLVFVHYNLCIRTIEILDSDTSPITLEKVDPESKWITEGTNPVFHDDDLEWVDEANKEGEAMAMEKEDQRAPVVPRGTSQTLAEPKTIVDTGGTSQADAMDTQPFRTYFRCLTKRHFIDYT